MQTDILIIPAHVQINCLLHSKSHSLISQNNHKWYNIIKERNDISINFFNLASNNLNCYVPTANWSVLYFSNDHGIMFTKRCTFPKCL